MWVYSGSAAIATGISLLDSAVKTVLYYGYELAFGAYVKKAKKNKQKD